MSVVITECSANSLNNLPGDFSLNMSTPAKFADVFLRAHNSVDFIILNSSIIVNKNYNLITSKNSLIYHLPDCLQDYSLTTTPSLLVQPTQFPNTPLFNLNAHINSLSFYNSFILEGGTSQQFKFSVFVAPEIFNAQLHSAVLTIKYKNLVTFNINYIVINITSRVLGQVDEVDTKSYPDLIFSINGVETSNIFSLV